MQKTSGKKVTAKKKGTANTDVLRALCQNDKITFRLTRLNLRLTCLNISIKNSPIL